MICSRVSAGLRGNGLRAALGTATAKVAAARERRRDGAGRAGPGLGRLGSGSASALCEAMAGGAAASSHSRCRPALPCRRRRGWQPCARLWRTSPPQLVFLLAARLPGLVPFSFFCRRTHVTCLEIPMFPSPLSPYSYEASGCASKRFFQLASAKSLLLFPVNSFSGYGLVFGSRTPGKQCKQKS